MNFILIILAIPLICMATAIYLVLRDHAAKRRTDRRRQAASNSRGVLPHGWAALIFTSTLCLVSVSPACAQQIIHGRAGQVVGVDPGKTLTIRVADDSTVVFRDVANPEPALAFDKDIRGRTVAAGAFHTLGAYVVVLYYGFDTPTAVAVGYLGPTPPKRSIGSVEGFDRHKRLLTLKTDTQPLELAISDDTIVDTPEGVVKAANFHPNKGEQLRCFAKPESQAALFVAPN